MVNLPPSRREVTGPPPTDPGELAAIAARHQAQSLRSRDPGYLGGHFATPHPVPPGSLSVGETGGGDDCPPEWEWDDRLTVTATGTQNKRLSHEPLEEGLTVRWHPSGRGGLILTRDLFTVQDQVVTIPDSGVLAVGDEFSFQYQYDTCVEDVLDLEFIGCVSGVSDPTAKTLTFDPLPAGAQPGDLIIVAGRGAVAPGGGDITLGLSCADSRVSLQYTATPPVIEAIWAGFLTDPGAAPLVVNIIENPSYIPGAWGVLAVFRGANSITSVNGTESGGITPQVGGSAAIAITWAGNASFTVVHADPPTGYTAGCSTGLNYGATGISYWADPSGDSSPAGTWTDEGCVILGLT